MANVDTTCGGASPSWTSSSMETTGPTFAPTWVMRAQRGSGSYPAFTWAAPALNLSNSRTDPSLMVGRRGRDGHRLVRSTVHCVQRVLVRGYHAVARVAGEADRLGVGSGE